MIHEQAEQIALILASKSPRRALMLGEAGFDFEQAEPPFDDPPQPKMLAHQTPSALATALAEKKARSLAEQLRQSAVILAADTICVDERDNLIGTPSTEGEAREMIRTFSDCSHQVVTGVCLLAVKAASGEQAAIETVKHAADIAHVTLGKLSADQVEDYLALGTWQGKAGGYNLTERVDAGWPIDVQGDPTTVVGLPMAKVVPLLIEMGCTRTTRA